MTSENDEDAESVSLTDNKSLSYRGANLSVFSGHQLIGMSALGSFSALRY